MVLLLVQTFFLCKCTPPVQSENIRWTIIYIDAYPGDHISYLSEMFPHISFRLYDQRFSGSRVQKISSSGGRIQVNPRPFTESEAQQIGREFFGDKAGS